MGGRKGCGALVGSDNERGGISHSINQNNNNNNNKGRAVGWFYVLDTASITTNRPVALAAALTSNGDPFVVCFFFLLF